MKEMKTLTLGNQTYEVVDGKAARSNAIVDQALFADWEYDQLDWEKRLDGTFTLTKLFWEAVIADDGVEEPIRTIFTECPMLTRITRLYRAKQRLFCTIY